MIACRKGGQDVLNEVVRSNALGWRHSGQDDPPDVVVQAGDVNAERRAVAWVSTWPRKKGDMRMKVSWHGRVFDTILWHILAHSTRQFDILSYILSKCHITRRDAKILAKWLASKTRPTMSSKGEPCIVRDGILKAYPKREERNKPKPRRT